MNAILIFFFYIIFMWVEDIQLFVLDAPEFICFINFKIFIDIITHFLFLCVLIWDWFFSTLFDLSLISLLTLLRLHQTLSPYFSIICKLRGLLKVPLLWRDHIYIIILLPNIIRSLLLLTLVYQALLIIIILFLIKLMLELHTIVTLIF